MARTLIRNATVITVDPTPGHIRGGDILIEGSKIAAVGHRLEAGGVEVLDAGKEADIEPIDTNGMSLIPVDNPVVGFSRIGNIDSVFVAGQARERNDKLVGDDFPPSTARSIGRAMHYFERAAAPTDGTWSVKPYQEESNLQF